MRMMEQLTVFEPLRQNKRFDDRIMRFIRSEIELAYSARAAQDTNWLECLRQYEGVPLKPYRDSPIENGPNVEITLGAIASDSLYAQAMANTFNQSPVLTVRATRRAEEMPMLADAATALNDFIEWGITNEWMLRDACEDTFLDCVQLGTGALYTPFVHYIKRTAMRKIVDYGPRIRSLAPEDMLAPGGAGSDIDQMPWFDVRVWMTKGEMKEHARVEEGDARWDISEAKATASIDPIRRRREELGRTNSGAYQTKLFEIHYTTCTYDYDNDGQEEEMLVIWDRTSGKILWRGYQPYDTRAIDACRYQKRPHLFHGIGVMEMLGPYQQEVTEGHNDRSVNVKLANFRMWAARAGKVDEGTLAVWENRVIPLANPKEDLVPLQLGEVYPSAITHEAATISLAERRVGVNELNTPRPSQVLGSRTPAFTTASLMQKQNDRFAPAYDSMKNCAAGAVRQCLWRYHERLLSEGQEGMAAKNIRLVLGEKRGQLVIDLLRADDFLQSVSVELTASSATINKDADKQNALLLTQILQSYYDKILALTQIAANTQLPQTIRDVAGKAAEALTTLTERTVRTFDQIRDPQKVLIAADQEIDQALAEQPHPAIAGVAQLLRGLGIGGADGGGADAGGDQTAQQPLPTAQQ